MVAEDFLQDPRVRKWLDEGGASLEAAHLRQSAGCGRSRRPLRPQSGSPMTSVPTRLPARRWRATRRPAANRTASAGCPDCRSDRYHAVAHYFYGVICDTDCYLAQSMARAWRCAWCGAPGEVGITLKHFSLLVVCTAVGCLPGAPSAADAILAPISCQVESVASASCLQVDLPGMQPVRQLLGEPLSYIGGGVGMRASVR